MKVDNDEDCDTEFALDDADAAYQTWYNVKMMALMLHDNYTSHFGLTSTAAASEVAQLLALRKQ